MKIHNATTQGQLTLSLVFYAECLFIFSASVFAILNTLSSKLSFAPKCWGIFIFIPFNHTKNKGANDYCFLGEFSERMIGKNKHQQKSNKYSIFISLKVNKSNLISIFILKMACRGGIISYTTKERRRGYGQGLYCNRFKIFLRFG